MRSVAVLPELISLPNEVMHHIGVRDLSKTFETPMGSVEALSTVSFDIAVGEFVSIVGPSGCGKSTLLKIVAGLLPATTGSVTINGESVIKPFTDLGIVFQRDLLLESRTALDNVLLQVEMRGLNKDAYKERGSELLERMGLSGFIDKYPWQLSGGMRQRVSICRALIHDPPLMLMDEPFGALDALTREEIALDLARLCERTKKTVLFITHSISEAVFLSDRVFVMTARPARIAKEIAIELPRPRRSEQQEERLFARHTGEIRSLLFREEKRQERD